MTEQNVKRITDELREFIDDGYPAWKLLRKTVHVIADRIDAAHEDALSRLYMDMSDSEWVRLPKDADGESIHVGDMLADRLSQSFTPKKVKMLMLEGDGWMLNFGGGWCAMKHHEWYHLAPDTWERIIEDAIYCDQTLYEHDPDAAVDFANTLVARCKALAGGEQ